MFQVNRLTELNAPISVNLEVTEKCNLHCSFCFNAAPVYKKFMDSSSEEHEDGSNRIKLLEVSAGNRISDQQIRKERIFKILDILADAGVFEIRLFGGEFTVFKQWREVLKYAFERNFFISFVSNGYLLNADDVDLLAKCGVKDCTISVHGPEDVHDKVTGKVGSFQRAMRAVELLREKGITVSVAYTPHKQNIPYIYEFVSLLAERYSVEYFSISRLFSDDRYECLELRDYHYLLREIDRCHRVLGVVISLADSFPRCKVPMKYWKYLSYCSQGVAFGQVDFNGNIKHCSATSKPLGSLLDDPLKYLWNKKLEGMRNLDHLPKSCRICPIFCGGGCTVSRGVQHQFAPDEFIPWPKDEGWIGAIQKSLWNRLRKILFSIGQLIQSRQRKKKDIPLSDFPALQ